MDPTIKTQKIEDVKQALSNIKNSQNPIPSTRACEFCTNVSMLLSDWQYEKSEKVKNWIQIYDIQENMSLLLETILNPLHLPLEECEAFENDIKVVTDFIEFIR